MWKRCSNTVLLLFVLATTVKSDTCEDQVTSEMKIKLVKDSLTTVKALFPRCKDPEELDAKCSKRETAMGHMNLALDTLTGIKIVGIEEKNCPKCPDFKPDKPLDCSDYLRAGQNKNGLYMLYPRSRLNGTYPLVAYCDMETDGGGWTVIQRRGAFKTLTDFNQDWEIYKRGFGELQMEFWLGNDNIYTLTNQGFYSLRVDLRNKNDEYRYAVHDRFWIENETNAYSLYLGDFTGNATNDMSTQHKTKFSTKDRQNDMRPENDSCNKLFSGGWWYPQSNCGHTNPNGVYMPGVGNRNSNWWWNWTGYEGLKSSEMKIRPRSYK